MNVNLLDLRSLQQSLTKAFTVDFEIEGHLRNHESLKARRNLNCVAEIPEIFLFFEFDPDKTQ